MTIILLGYLGLGMEASKQLLVYGALDLNQEEMGSHNPYNIHSALRVHEPSNEGRTNTIEMSRKGLHI